MLDYIGAKTYLKVTGMILVNIHAEFMNFCNIFFSQEISPMLFLVELKWNRFAWRIPIDLKWTSEFKMAASIFRVGNSISRTASDAGGCVVLAPPNFFPSVFFLCLWGSFGPSD